MFSLCLSYDHVAGPALATVTMRSSSHEHESVSTCDCCDCLTLASCAFTLNNAITTHDDKPGQRNAWVQISVVDAELQPSIAPLLAALVLAEIERAALAA